MAERNFKVGESIEVTYQAGNGESGLTVQMRVVKPDKTFVLGDPVVLSEVGNSGRYWASFVPKTVVDGIASSMGALDTPPMAF